MTARLQNRAHIAMVVGGAAAARTYDAGSYWSMGLGLLLTLWVLWSFRHRAEA